MRKIIEIQELTLSPDTIGLSESYPTPGIYLVLDGYGYHLVSTRSGGSCPCMMPVDPNVFDLVTLESEEIGPTLEKANFRLNISEECLLKAIAIARDPKLALNLLGTVD